MCVCVCVCGSTEPDSITSPPHDWQAPGTNRGETVTACLIWGNFQFRSAWVYSCMFKCFYCPAGLAKAHNHVGREKYIPLEFIVSVSTQNRTLWKSKTFARKTLRSAVKKLTWRQWYSCWGDQTCELWDTEDIFLDVCDIKPVITAVFVFVFWLVNVTGVSKS